jgi:uncharacterized protein YndB with AHSA1/START domain
MITVSTKVKAPINKVWDCWNNPKHITQWCHANDDWHAPRAENDLKVGGKFSTTMAAKDGSFSFDFGGTYSKVEQNKAIDYTMGDGRKVQITFAENNGEVEVIESFDPESQNPEEMQRQGWQAILDNFRKYTEKN